MGVRGFLDELVNNRPHALWIELACDISGSLNSIRLSLISVNVAHLIFAGKLELLFAKPL
jgi:hypothetical protein